ncbi:hypothetical protein WA026_020503 [Henosepilachna vigintioctopunctata]|uniref:Uncharacterized protein n=1 Tax=Henosepilachna vigintioctopunctata TaxID=420089 RepID=A0AAW1VI13_9CUCU
MNESSFDLAKEMSIWSDGAFTMLYGKARKKFSLLHLNVQGLGNKMNLLEVYLKENGYTDVVCICEHFLRSNFCEALNIDGWFTAATFGRSTLRHGGVAILCKH